MDFDKIFQESEMTQEEKMDAWHNGTRGFNIKAASTSKLRGNLAICKKKKYKSEVSAIEAELKSRGLKIKESVEDTNEIEAPVEHTAETETSSNPLWKVEALGEDEVRELFNNIRNGDSRIDQEFVEKIYEIFPDMPHAVEILHGDIAYIDADDAEGFNEELNNILSGDLYYANENDSGVCTIDDLWDFVGDGKNPLEVYVATYSRSDGMENTAILVYGDDWYKICKITDDVKEAVINNIFNVEGGEKVLNDCFQKEFGKPLFFNNKSIL